MSCRVYIGKYDYTAVGRGQRKKTESQNGRELLRIAVEDFSGAPCDLEKIRLGEHGKPYFPDSDIEFNISHSGDYAAAAVSDAPVGVDVQTIRPIRDALIKKLCRGCELDYVCSAPDSSRAFIRLWALKESYVKAIGTGMSFPMDEVNFDIAGFNEAMTGRLSNRGGLYHLRDYGGFVLAVCCLV